MHHRRTNWLLGVAFSGLVAGCYDADVHYENAGIDGAEVLRIDVGAGDVKLSGADVRDVTVRARIEGKSNHLGQSLTDGELTLFDDCHEQHCSVDVNAVIPAGAPVTVHTGAGDIEIEDLRGTITLRTGSGDIQAWDVAGTALSVETGSGDVSLDVGEPVEQIQVKTGSGDVSVGVPSGSYRMSIETGAGDRTLRGVSGDADALSSIEIRTGSGDVLVRGY